MSFAHLRVSEPAGARAFDGGASLGGVGADIVVPGCADGPRLRFTREDTIWHVSAADDDDCTRGNLARINGLPLRARQDLRPQDVISVGEAQIIVREVTRTLLSLDVRHLAGNQTVPPATLVSEPPPPTEASDGDADDLPIHPAPLPPRPERTPEAALRAWRRRLLWRITGTAALVIALITFTGITSITLDVTPADAAISTPGTLFSLHRGTRLFLFPGPHMIRAVRDGYRPAQFTVSVSDDGAQVVHLQLLKLPGTLAVDTHGVQATALIDGVEVGRVPGRIVAPAGTHTLLVRAARYLDHIETIAVAGAHQTQRVSVALEPSWGTLLVASDPPSARVQVDGADSGITPATLDLPAGIHELSLIAPGYRSWQGSVVIRPGERLAVGPVALGAPDAQVTVRSQPANAEVSIAGRYRGRTPVRVALAPGISYDLTVSLPGRAPFTQTFYAQPGASLAIDAALAAGSAARVTVSGEPADAEVWIDGVAHGTAPQTLMLDATEHRIEVRKAGYGTYATKIAPSEDLERQLIYHLSPGEHSIALKDSAATIAARIGYVLKLVPGVSEHARALPRPFYIGIRPVTNGDFRRFRAAHDSGSLGSRSLDRDDQPVVRVSWEEAAEFCNWLSGEDGLPPAYVAHDGRYALARPVTTGYRLPTEAEWDYAAHGAGPEARPILIGLRDAPGNADAPGRVFEWINDWYGPVHRTAAGAADPLGPATGNKHLIRGVNSRDGADAASPTLGFRIARYAQGAIQ